MSETPTPPALTAEEWTDVRDDAYWWAARVDELACDCGAWFTSRTNTPRPHTLAALALHGQPFGFTPDDLEACRWAGLAIAGELHAARDSGRTADARDWRKAGDMINALADKIAALLPPE